METEIRIQRVLMQIEGASNHVEVDITSETRTLEDGYKVKEILKSEFVTQGGVQ